MSGRDMGKPDDAKQMIPPDLKRFVIRSSPDRDHLQLTAETPQKVE